MSADRGEHAGLGRAQVWGKLYGFLTHKYAYVAYRRVFRGPFLGGRVSGGWGPQRRSQPPPNHPPGIPRGHVH
eukprot:1142473-Pelagomonas_calceolata.AAC.11